MTHTLFVFVTASGAARHAPELVRGAVSMGWQTFTVLTPNVGTVVPPEQIHALSGSYPIRDYGQPPLDVFPFGTMLVAPCTFNTFNKLALGLADNLATAMLADALGAGCPVFIAPAMNHGLWHHPQTRASRQRLAAWGCTIIPPRIDDYTVTMASIADILQTLGQHFDHTSL